MPSKSSKQQQMIFAKRNQYGSKEKTPEKDKWIWEAGWNKIEESFLDSYLSKVYNEETFKFGFEINVKDEKTGENEKHFIKANTIDDFMKEMHKVAPELDEQSKKTIREKLAAAENEKMH